MPVYVADAARQAGEDPVIIALTNEADRDWSSFDHANLGVGNFAGLRSTFRRYGVDRVVMSGGVARRPAWREVHPTWRVIKELPSTIRTLLSGGDNAVLQMVIRLIEAGGVRVVGAHEIAPDLLATTGPLGRLSPRMRICAI